MNKETVTTSLEKSNFKILLIIAIIVSGVSIIGNIILEFPLDINLKWVSLIVICSICLKVIEKSEKWFRALRLIFILFLILILIPYGWIDCGGYNNNIGYIFILLMCIVIFFNNNMRTFLVLLLISITLSLFVLECYYPELIRVYNQQSEFYDRLFQIPMIFIVTYILLKKIVNAYEEEKVMLNQYSKDLEYLATRDPLTGLYNRRFFNEHFTTILSQQTPINNGLYLVLFDIDEFKKINDNYGHLFGDKVIRELASKTEEITPTNSLVSRWGGDEFAILYRGTKNELDEYIKLLGLHIANIECERTITISIGTTQILEGDSIDEAIKRADDVLYTSKHYGRNKETIN